MKSFNIRTKGGFHLKFENGYILSTQFGYGSYSENYNNYEAFSGKGFIESNNAEIAIWKEDNSKYFSTKEIFEKIGKKINDDVAAKVSFDEWLKIVDILKTL